MNLNSAKVVSAVRVFGAIGVSAYYGNKVLRQLEEVGEIDPHRTGTGRVSLTFEEAQRLADRLTK